MSAAVMFARLWLARGQSRAPRMLISAVALFPLACSSNRAGDARAAGDDALIVPEGLTVTALAGGNGVLEVIALTLRKGPSNLELYAALKNNGAVPACNAALSVELFDKTERSMAAGIGGLLTQHFYRLTDAIDTVAACVGPGDVAMAALTDLPSDIAIEELGTIVYRCPYFALDVVPIEGLSIREVKSVAGSAGTACTGILVNGLEVAVNRPSVTVFPVNRVGRPLGMATETGIHAVAPGGRWAFEINSGAPGMGCIVYPSGAPAK